MPANFLETQNIKMPFTEYMSMVERTSMKSLLRRAAEQRSENKVKRLVDDYKTKVNNDKSLLNQIEGLPVISDNPKPVVKNVNVEQEIFEKQPLILRDSPIDRAVTANFNDFCAIWLDLSEPEKYQQVLKLIDEDLAGEDQNVFDVSTKENLILGLANRYAQNAIDARTLRKWKDYNFYMRSLAYFIPLLLEKADSKTLTNKVEKLQEEDNKVLSSIKKLVNTKEVDAARELNYDELVKELSEQFDIVKHSLDRIKDRFKYRITVNVSYPLDKANKLEDDLYNTLKKIDGEINKLWNKIG